MTLAQLEQDCIDGRANDWLKIQPREQRPTEADKRITSDRFLPRKRSFRGEGKSGAFSRNQTLRHFGRFQIVRGTSEDCIAILGSSLDDVSDYWCLVVSPCPTAGPTMTGGRPVGICELHFQPLNRGNGAGFGAAPVMMMLLPSEMFAEGAVALGNPPFTVPDVGIGALVIDYMLALEQRLPSLWEGELQLLVDVTRLLIAACLARKSFTDAVGHPRRGSRIQRAYELIRENLRSPAFGEADVRHTLGISRSSLYRLFNPLGGVKRCIQRERLAQARLLLADPLNERPIFKIAEELCFCDASSFSRAFKNEFGISPRAVRDHSGTGGRSSMLGQYGDS